MQSNDLDKLRIGHGPHKEQSDSAQLHISRVSNPMLAQERLHRVLGLQQMLRHLELALHVLQQTLHGLQQALVVILKWQR